MGGAIFLEVTMANDDRSTVRPPSGPKSSGVHPPIDPRFVVQLYYPNSLAIARAVATHLHKRVEDTLRRSDAGRKDRAYAGLSLDTTVYEKLNEHIRGVVVNTLIVGVDEFCDLDALFQEIERYFAKGTPIIIHVTAPTEMDLSIFVEYGAVGAFTGYNFSEADHLLDEAARKQLKPGCINIDSD